MDDTQAKALRAPFPPEVIGKLPRSTCKACSDDRRRRCDSHTWVSSCPQCHGGHSSAVIHLDYVGHAATTDRLLLVDPGWTWEPAALDASGLPAFDSHGNLWIRLTVAGVTRLGVGDGRSAKECIGDAIRNASMRFGVALDLWAKEDLSAAAPAPGPEQPATPAPTAAALVDPALHLAKVRLWQTWRTTQGNEDPAALLDAFRQANPGSELEEATVDQLDAYAAHLEQAPNPKKVRGMHAAYRAAGITDRDDRLAHMTATLDRPVTTSAGLSADDVATITKALATQALGTTTGGTP